MRARVGSPWFVPKLETRTGSAMPVTLRAVGTQVLRGCVWFVASLLLRCRGRFFRLLRALPHEAGFFSEGECAHVWDSKYQASADAPGRAATQDGKAD